MPSGAAMTAEEAISIHALRVEGDHHATDPCGGRLVISIHALRVEGDYARRTSSSLKRLFLSTPSVWRATGLVYHHASATCNFYPRPPCGGRLVGGLTCPKSRMISIHALRVEGDDDRVSGGVPVVDISIHALRVEGDNS